MVALVVACIALSAEVCMVNAEMCTLKSKNPVSTPKRMVIPASKVRVLKSNTPFQTLPHPIICTPTSTLLVLRG